MAANMAACAAAGYTKASFSLMEAKRIDYRVSVVHPVVEHVVIQGDLTLVEPPLPKTGEIDLTKYAPKKP